MTKHGTEPEGGIRRPRRPCQTVTCELELGHEGPCRSSEMDAVDHLVEGARAAVDEVVGALQELELGAPFAELDEPERVGAARRRQRRLFTPIEPLPPSGPSQGLLGFTYVTGGLWEAHPQRPFKPLGLAIWGTPAGTLVDQLLLGINSELLCSLDRVPARWFGQGSSYDEIRKMAEVGKLAPGWGTWRAAQPGQKFSIRLVPGVQLRGDLQELEFGPRQGVELCMWGLTVL